MFRSALLRLFLIFGALFVAAVGVGSLYARDLVLKRLAANSRAAASVVLARPFTLQVNDDINRVNLVSRLRRLGYVELETPPELPGQYHLSPNSIEIITRERIDFEHAGGKLPGAQVSVALNNSRVTAINQAAATIPSLTFEEEVIAPLSNSLTRASSPKPLQVFPPQLVQAVLSIEDERFYSHFGLDLIAITRAMLVNIQHRRLVQGGSTITQQLAKNLFFTNERTLSRKLLEVFAAPVLEATYSKNQILELYLNEVFLGQEGNVAIHGFGEAAESFFGKDVSQLSLIESATLAGIIKAPSKFSPRQHPQKAFERAQVVLEKMHDLGHIDDKALAAAKAQPPAVQQAKRSRRVAPYFIDFVRRTIENDLDLSSMNSHVIQVHTGIDAEYQICGEQAIETGLLALEKQYPRLRKKKKKVQAALVSVVPHSGEIRAWVGGREYGENQFDRISSAKRQPGSAFKPFVYLTALDRSLNSYRVARTTSILADEPLSLNIPGSGIWEPQNYDKEYRGEVTLRYALTHSLNVPTINLAQKVGVEAIAHTAALFGFGKDLPAVPSLALGAGEVTPLELARAYAAIANGGMLLNLRPILALSADESAAVFARTPLSEAVVASKQAVFVLTDILRSVVEGGTGNSVRRAGFKRPAAGKTGTTNDMRDAWFSGFTPSLLSIVWVGYDDNTPLGLTGGQSAAPIWADYMKCVQDMEPELDFVAPEGVVYRQIDAPTGRLASASCGGPSVTELFVEGTEPVSTCDEAMPENDALPSGLPPARSGGFFERIFN